MGSNLKHDGLEKALRKIEQSPSGTPGQEKDLSKGQIKSEWNRLANFMSGKK